MSDYTPTTEDVERAWAWWRKPMLERKRYFPDEKALFEVTNAELSRWLAGVQAEAVVNAADEAEQIILSGDIAEVAAPVPGESGRQSAVDHRDAVQELFNQQKEQDA